MTHLALATESAKSAPEWTRISAQWNNGSLPPPYRRSGSLVIDADGRAELQNVRGYTADAANTTSQRFQIEPETLRKLTENLSQLKAWQTKWQEAEQHPVGGSMHWLRLQTADQQVEIPPFPVARQAKRAEKIFAAVMAVVPKDGAAIDAEP